MASIFTKIIQGELPCEKIDENEGAIAFLDIFPCAYGHTLVVSKEETSKLEDLSPESLQSVMQLLKKVSTAVSKAYQGVDYNVVLNNGPDAGQEVPHLHFHIIPRSPGSPSPFKQRFHYQENELTQVGQLIRSHLQS